MPIGIAIDLPKVRHRMLNLLIETMRQPLPQVGVLLFKILQSGSGGVRSGSLCHVDLLRAIAVDIVFPRYVRSIPEAPRSTGLHQFRLLDPCWLLSAIQTGK
jgi:hypothetical protein